MADAATSSSAVHAMSGTSTVVTSSTATVVVFRSALCGSDWGVAGAAFATPAAIAVSATPAADAKAIGRAAFGGVHTLDHRVGQRATCHGGDAEQA